MTIDRSAWLGEYRNRKSHLIRSMTAIVKEPKRDDLMVRAREVETALDAHVQALVDAITRAPGQERDVAEFDRRMDALEEAIRYHQKMVFAYPSTEPTLVDLQGDIVRAKDKLRALFVGETGKQARKA